MEVMFDYPPVCEKCAGCKYYRLNDERACCGNDADECEYYEEAKKSASLKEEFQIINFEKPLDK